MRSIPGRLITALFAALLVQACSEAAGGGDEPAADAMDIAADEVAEVGGTSTLEPQQASDDGTSEGRYQSVVYGVAQVTSSDDEEDDANYPERRYREPFDEDDARQEAESDVSSETYRSIGRPYGCTDDCSGHEAGFKHRVRKGYGSRMEGDYEARSFRQGQQAYDDEVDRRVEEAQEEYDADDQAE